MKELVDKIIELDYKEIDKLNIPIDETIGLIIYLNDVKYEFILNFKSQSNKIIAIGSGALNNNSTHDRNRPWFNRWSWIDLFDESVVYYNDPTLYLSSDFLCGWGVGTEYDYYLEHIKDIIVAIADLMEIKSEHILFYGSSAGGFTSIILATLVRGSMALADIPQMDLRNYGDWNLRNFKKYSFPGKSEEYIFENYSHRLSVIEMIRKENYIPNAYLTLDFTFDFDFDNQYKPFFESLRKIQFDGLHKDNTIKLIIYGKNLGHVPIGQKYTLDIIRNIFINQTAHLSGEKFYKFCNNLEDFNYDYVDSLLYELTDEISVLKNCINEQNAIITNLSDENKNLKKLLSGINKIVKK